MEASESRRTWFFVESLYDRTLAGLLQEAVYRFSAKVIREMVLVDRSRVCDGDFSIVLAKSGFISGACCPILNEDDHAANRVRVSRTEKCEMHEHRVYASRYFAAKRIMLKIFVVIGGDCDEENRSEWRGYYCCVFSLRRETREV